MRFLEVLREHGAEKLEAALMDLPPYDIGYEEFCAVQREALAQKADLVEVNIDLVEWYKKGGDDLAMYERWRKELHDRALQDISLDEEIRGTLTILD